MVKISDAEDLRAHNDQQLSTQVSTDVTKESANALVEQIRSDMHFLFGREKVLNEAGELIELQREPVRDKAGDLIPDANLADEFNEMAEKRLQDGLVRIEQAIASFDAANEPIDPKASDQDVARQLLYREACAKEITRVTTQLLNEMENTAIAVVPRQPISDPNSAERKSGKSVMGTTATDVAGAPSGEKYEWLHLLARRFGGTDTITDFVTGNKEPHKDMTRLEGLANAIAADANVEVQITCAHRGVKYSDDIKERNGYELRLQVWASDKDSKSNPNAVPIVDASLDLRSSVRDADLKQVYEQLSNLRHDLQAGRSPDEAVRRFNELIDFPTETLSEQEIRTERIWQELTGGDKELPKDE